MNTIQTISFDYSTVPDDTAKVLRHAAQEVQRVLHRSVPEIGQHLLDAKNALPHGQFVAWVEAELHMKARAAQNYMSAAAWLEGKNATLAQLPPTIVYALAAPNAPDELVEDVVRAAEAGAPLPVATIKTRLDRAAVEASELKALARLHPKKSAAQIKKLRQEQKAEGRRHQEAQQREDDERTARLTPLAATVAAAFLNSGVNAAPLLADWRDWRKFTDLLHAALREREA